MTSRIGNRTPRPPGFTLVELLLVIAVMGSLVGIAVPRMKETIARYQFQSSVDQFEVVLSSLQDRAGMERKIIQLNLANGSNEYVVNSQSKPDQVRTYALPQRLTIETDRQTVLFYPDGSIDDVTIVLAGAGQNRARLTTQGLYGQFKVTYE